MRYRQNGDFRYSFFLWLKPLKYVFTQRIYLQQRYNLDVLKFKGLWEEAATTLLYMYLNFFNEIDECVKKRNNYANSCQLLWEIYLLTILRETTNWRMTKTQTGKNKYS